MKLALTNRRMAVLTAIHECGEAAPSTICHETGYGPGTIYPALEVFERAQWIGWKPHPTRKGARLYHLTLLGQIGAGFQPMEPTA
jgi:DNA-binding MarR family transcriptional regulator